MKAYIPVTTNVGVFLKQENPLINSPGLVSKQMYDEHERLYDRDKILLLNPIAGRMRYVESEIDPVWQYNSALNGFPKQWQDVSEPNYIDTVPDDYRQVFRLRETLTENGTYQDQVSKWVVACFGEEIAADIEERNYRFLEEALELVQALGCSKENAIRLVCHVFSRPKGEPYQEVGGVMVTLAALCAANELDMQQNGETELARVWEKIDAIRHKQASRPVKSPLPA